MSRINKQQPGSGEEKSRSLRKNALATAVGVALGATTGMVPAALPNGTLLNFDPGTPVVTGCSSGNFTGTSCTIGGTPYTAFEVTDMGGSYFRMNQGGLPASEKTAISMFAPLNIGSTQTSSGQHTGKVDGSESPAIDNAWNFFGNTGMHSLLSPISVISDGGATQTLDFSGWGVNWSEFGPGGASGPTISMGGSATIVCDVDCSNGDGYNLDMDVHVPEAFPSVPYSLHLEGTISLPGNPPVLNDDPGNVTIVGNPRTIDVLANDTSGDGFDLASQAIVTPPANGVTAINGDGTITYTPNTAPDFVGTNTFEYTINSGTGTPPDPEPGGSGPALVTVDVQNNVKPVAVNDTAETSTAVLSNTPLVINVLANDTDVNNAPGLPGGIDTDSVILVNDAGGRCVKTPGGTTITYSQTPPAVIADDTCTYRISDIDTFNAPLESDVASIAITVTETSSDWPVALDPDIIPVLHYVAGVPGDPIDTSVPAQSGSYFTMQVTVDTLIYTMMVPGPSGGVVIGHDQPAGNSHTGFPTGDEETGIELGWAFFSNTGFTKAKNGGIAGNPDGTLRFGDKNGSQGRWIITWSGIPEIDLGGDPTGTFPEDLGFATIACTPAPCADQSSFELEYAAHVPPGDPSGFGGVPYTLILEGTVSFMDGKLKTSTGNVTSEARMLADEVITSDPDAEVALQCVGDCFDYTIENVATSSASIVIPLAGGVPLNPVWRILDNGTWRSFDTTVDSIKSAPFVPGSGECPDPGDPAYVAPLSEGDACIQLTIADNGLNDLNPAVGTISDPSGMGSGGSAGGGTEFVDTRTSSTSESWGCSIMANNVNPLQRSDWWLMAGFIGWLGWSRGKRRQH